MAALPSLTHQRGYDTFRRRFDVRVLRQLDPGSIRTALLVAAGNGFDGTGVGIDDAAAHLLAERSHGEPFLLQLAGEAAWLADGATDAITVDHVGHGLSVTHEERLRFARQLLEDIPPAELAVLDAVLALPSEQRRPSTVAESMGRRASQIGAALSRLSARAVLMSVDGQLVVTSTLLPSYLEHGTA